MSVFNKMVSVDSKRCGNNHSIFYLLKIQFVMADHELDVLIAKFQLKAAACTAVFDNSSDANCGAFFPFLLSVYCAT